VATVKAGIACAALATLATVAPLAACGSTTGRSQTDSVRPSSAMDREATNARRPPERVAPPHCPVGHPACRSTEGRIVYVERVDPDGDGDAHFVVADPQGITLPGLTAIDVRAGLRPRPLPGPGDLISAAGPVQTGSYGQSQIHALELHVAGEP